MNKKLYIEKVKLNYKKCYSSSELVPATNDQIAEFKSKSCDHDIRLDHLVYYEDQFPDKALWCGVCNNFIGVITGEEKFVPKEYVGNIGCYGNCIKVGYCGSQYDDGFIKKCTQGGFCRCKH